MNLTWLIFGKCDGNNIRNETRYKKCAKRMIKNFGFILK